MMDWSKKGNINIAALVTIVLCNTLIARCSRQLIHVCPADWVFVTETLAEEEEETRLDAFEIKGLRKILRISWTAKKTKEWVLNKAGVKRELLDIVKARKLAYYGHTMRKQRNNYNYNR